MDFISIHAPREGRDPCACKLLTERTNFNPRAPRGARPLLPQPPHTAKIRFQSTRPARGATNNRWVSDLRRGFQSTRPARGATELSDFLCQRQRNFNPRAPRGARLILFAVLLVFGLFQSTRPARGATAKVNKFLCTFLQKRHGFQISLRKTLPFKAFCRLQIGKNFSICGANRCGNFCELLLRTIRSSVLPEGRSACSQNAQFYSHTFSRDNRNADCLFPDP